MLLLELMCSAVMIVAGINVFYCDDCTEIDIRCQFVCCAAKFCFTAATEPPAANWYSLPICVLPSEILFRCRNWTCCSELIFTADLCVAAAKVSPPQLNLLQRIDIRCRFVCCAAKFCFAAATKPPAANWYSLPICVLRGEILFHCRNWTSCSELIFAADLCVAQRNSVSLPQLNLLQRSDIRCRVVHCAAKLWLQQRCSSRCRTGRLRRTSSRCRIGQPAANQFSLPIPTISLLGRNDLNANNNFMIW